jgi:hypothetical protein
MRENNGADWAGEQTHTSCKANAPYRRPQSDGRLGDVEFVTRLAHSCLMAATGCDGTEPFRVTGAAGLGKTAVGLFAYANNRIANFANPSPGDFKLSGGVTADAASKPAGAASSLRLVVSAGASMVPVVSPCEPGTIATAAATIRTAGVSANHGTVGIQIGYLDVDGHLLASNEPNPSGYFVLPVQADRAGPAARAARHPLLPGPVCGPLPGGAVQLWPGYPRLIVQ